MKFILLFLILLNPSFAGFPPPIYKITPATTNGKVIVSNGITGSKVKESTLTGIASLSSGLLSAFTLSSGLSSVISDETGTGVLVFSVSPALTGNPTVPNQSALDSSNKIANTKYVDDAISVIAGVGVLSINSDTSGAQTFTVGSTGLAPAWVDNLSGDHKINIPLASGAGVTSGTISKVDYDIFNAKQPALGFTAENVANKDTDGTLTANSDTKYASQKAIKTYVDTQLAQLNPLQGVEAASTANVTGTYLNGVACIGATLTVTATGSFVVDGYTTALNDRVLLKNQTSGFQNGVYTVTTAGSIGVSAILTRTLDYDTSVDMNAGDLIPVINGTANTITSWLQTATISTCGTDSLTFTQWTKDPSTYLVKTNNLSDVSNSTTAFNNISGMTLLGDLVYGGASGARTVLAGNTTATKKFLSQTGNGSVSAAPSWLQPAFSDISGTATVAQGGTGQTSYTDGQLLIGNTSGNTLTKATITAGSNVTITNGNGTITIASSAASPSFAYRSVTSTDTATTADYTLILSGASFTENLYTAVGNTGKILEIIHNGTSLTQVYTIDPSGAQTADGQSTLIIYTLGEKYKLQSDGANWVSLEHKTSMLTSSCVASTLTAITTNPTKGTIVKDCVQYGRDGKYMTFQLDLQQSTAGTSGSGAYLITLPGGVSVDTNYVTVNSTTNTSNIWGPGSLDGGCSGNAGASLQVIGGLAIMHNSTQFKVTGLVGGTNSIWGSSILAMGNTAVNMQCWLRIPIDVWRE